MPGKTPMWGNPTREREREREREILLFNFTKIHISNKLTISIQEKIPHGTKIVPCNFFLEICAKSVQLYGPLKKNA